SSRKSSRVFPLSCRPARRRADTATRSRNSELVRSLLVLFAAAALPAFAEEQAEPAGLEPEFVRPLVPVAAGRNDSNPVWSPVGDMLAFERSRGDDKEILVVRLNGDIVQTIHQQSPPAQGQSQRSEEHTSELQSRFDLVCRLLLEKKKKKIKKTMKTIIIKEKLNNEIIIK